MKAYGLDIENGVISGVSFDASPTGNSHKYLRLNATEDGVEWADVGGTGGVTAWPTDSVLILGATSGGNIQKPTGWTYVDHWGESMNLVYTNANSYAANVGNIAGGSFDVHGSFQANTKYNDPTTTYGLDTTDWDPLRGGSLNFSNTTFGGATAGHAITVNEMPVHNHTISTENAANAGGGTGINMTVVGYSDDASVNHAASAGGSNQAHSHTLSLNLSSQLNSLVVSMLLPITRYVAVTAIKKD